MKNLFGLSAALVLCALTVGCGDKDDDTAVEDTADTADQQDTGDSGSSEND
jgi:hypothetical protein